MDFKTTTINDFSWPFPRPIVAKPCEPPVPSPPSYASLRPVAPYCHCDSNSYAPRVEQYKQLLEKEQKLCQDYELLKKQIVDVTNDVLQNPSDAKDSAMATTYQSSYQKRSAPVMDYQSIMAAAQSNAPRPVTNIQNILRCYKDPTHFTSDVGLVPLKYRQIVATDYPGLTEYMDTYSASAIECWRSMQRLKHPMPSARRRVDRNSG